MGSPKPWGMGGYGLEEGRDTLPGLRPGSSLAAGMGKGLRLREYTQGPLRDSGWQGHSTASPGTPQSYGDFDLKEVSENQLSHPPVLPIGEGACPGSRSQEEALLTQQGPVSQPRDPSCPLFPSCFLPEAPLPRALSVPLAASS